MRQSHRGSGSGEAPPPRAGASSAFAWSLLNTVVSRLATLGIGIVLARVLGPESFGTFAVALVALMAVLSFNELGVSLAIVRWKGDPARIAPTVATVSLAASALFCAAAYSAAPAFAAAMGDPEAAGVVRVLILSVLINGAVAVPAALLQRNFQERTRLVIDQANVWLGAVLSLLLALTGFGAMGLALGRLVGSVVAGFLFVRSSPLPYRLGWDRTQVMPLLRFGLPLAGSSIIVFGVGYADQLTVGSMLGPTALGFYVLAFNLASWPVSIVSQPLRRVAPAAFSRLRHDTPALREAMLSIVGVLAAGAVPLFCVLAGCALQLVAFVYGSDWLPAAAALNWLVLAALVRIFCELVYDYLVVVGRTGSVFAIQAGSFPVLVPALAVGAHFGGLAGVAVAQAVVAACLVLPLHLWQLRRTGFAVRGLARKVRLPLLVGVLAGGAAAALPIVVPKGIAALVLAALLASATAGWMLYLRRAELRQLHAIGRQAPEEVVV